MSRYMWMRYEAVMITVGAWPWIDCDETKERISRAVELGVSEKGARLDRIDFHESYMSIVFSVDEKVRATSVVWSAREAMNREFAEVPPKGLAGFKLSRGLFSKQDFAICTLGTGVPDDITKELLASAAAKRPRRRRVSEL